MPSTDSAPSEKRLKDFGLVLGAILGIFGLLSLRRHPGRVYPYLSFAVLSAALAILRVQWLGPVYTVWMKFARMMAAINTFIFLGVVYYGLLTPYAWMLRWTGTDVLDEKMGTAGSYWRLRQEQPGPESYRRQY
jgi:hypothetical protein